MKKIRKKIFICSIEAAMQSLVEIFNTFSMTAQVYFTCKDIDNTRRLIGSNINL